MNNTPKSTTDPLIQRITQAIGGEESGEQFSLHNGQIARLVIERRRHSNPESGNDWEDEYPRAYVELDMPRIDGAVIAAVAALRGKTVAKKDMLKVRRQLPAMRWNDAALRALAAGEPRPEKPAELSGATVRDVQGGYIFKLANDLLQHYRADYSELTPDEQVRLVIQVVERTNELLEAVRRLVQCIQYADPNEGVPRTPVKNAGRDVRAAELRDIEELNYVEIGKRIGVKQFPSEEFKNDNRRVREVIVPNGRRILRDALGVEGFEQHIESGKAERDRRRILSRDELELEDWAEMVGVSVEDMRLILEGSEEDLLAAQLKLDETQVFMAALARAAWTDLPRD